MTKTSKFIFMLLPLFLGVFFPFFASAQLNVLSGGYIGVGTNVVHYYTTLNVLNGSNYPCIDAQQVCSHDYQWCYNARLNRTNGVGYRVENSGGVGTWWVVGAGWMYANGSYYKSDSNLKSSILPIDSALWKIMHLQGYTYLLHNRSTPDSVYTGGPVVMDSALADSQRQIGYIAQQVGRVIPQLVKTTQYGESAINYTGIIPLLSEAIKAQQAEITLGEDSLKTSILHLKDSLGSQDSLLKIHLQTVKDSLGTLITTLQSQNILLQSEENNTASRLEYVNDSMRTVVTTMQTQENNTAVRVEYVNDSLRTVITSMQIQENNTATRMEFIKDSLAWQTVLLQFTTNNILNSIRQMRDSLIETFACNCNGSGSGGTPDAALFGGSLGQNSPNPFNTQTTISYSLTGTVSSASINIYNMQGTLMSTYNLQAASGHSSINVAANTLKAGTYIYNLVVNNVQVDSKEMVITN